MGFTGGVKVFIEYLRKSWGSGCCPVGCTAIPRHLHDKTYRKHCLNIEKSGYCRLEQASPTREVVKSWDILDPAEYRSRAGGDTA